MDILNYNKQPFGYAYDKHGRGFIASGYKMFPYFIEAHYGNDGKLLEIAIINVKLKMGL